MHGQTDPTTDNDCAQAIAWLKNFTLSDINSVSSDDVRWDGENALLIYDWCHYALSENDIHNPQNGLLQRWNGYTATLNAKPWGGMAMPANNYFWGYLRNSLLWGIASYNDGGTEQMQKAQGFINHALDVRYKDLSPLAPNGSSKFQAWYEAFGVGGVPLEGTQYGPYMFDYPVIGFTTATDYGYRAWSAVPFWRDAMYYLYYAAPPLPTKARDGAQGRYEIFPFNDDQFFKDGGSADGNYSNFVAAMALQDPTSPVARMALSWLTQRGQSPSWWVRAELSTLQATQSTPYLPLDYYADGSQFLYGRRSQAPEQTMFMLQLGGANAYTSNVSELAADGGVGHSHQDLGNFQLWRKGRWLTRETTGYNIFSDGIVGWNNGIVVDPLEGVAHNTALFEGRGQIYTRRGWSTVLRVQSAPEFSFAAVDMTESYRAPATQSWLAEDDWPFAEVAIREFIYLRSLDALLILDRMKSGNDSLDPIYDVSYTGPQKPAEQVRKSFVLHATGTGSNENGNPFTLGAGQATATVGDQRLDLRTLLPSNPSYRVIDEGGDIGQFRLEYDVSGTAMSYLINVVSVRDETDPTITASLEDLGNVWRINLSRGAGNTATVTLNKGEVSTGGSVRINQAAAIPLRENRQGIVINNYGVYWAGRWAKFDSKAVPPQQSSPTPGRNVPRPVQGGTSSPTGKPVPTLPAHSPMAVGIKTR